MPTLSSNIVKLEVASVRDVEAALARQALYGGDLATNLLELSSVSEEQLTRVIAESMELEPAPAGELPISVERVRRFVPGDVAQRYVLYPLEESGGTLTVAVSEPLSAEVTSDLEFSLGLGLSQRATTRIRVEQAIARDYGMKLDRRVERVLAQLAGKPDPYPTGPPQPTSDRSLEVQPEIDDRPPIAEDDRTHVGGESTDSLQPGAESLPPGAGSPENDSLQPESSVASPLESEAPALPLVSKIKQTRALPKLDLASLSRAEKAPPRRRRRLGPYTATMAERDLVDAETRDDVLAAFFDFAAQYFDYSALFQVHGELAEGRDAQGTGAPRNKVRGIGVPLDLPSTLASAINEESYRLARLSPSGLDGALLKDLDRQPGPAVLLLPVRVRGRAVLVLYGDHGETDVELAAVGNVIAFAPLVAAALERFIRRRKGQPREESLAGAHAVRSPMMNSERARLPSKLARAEALAQALEANPRPSESPRPESSPSASAPSASVPPFARPVISVGPGRRTTPRGVSARPASAEASSAGAIPPAPSFAPLPSPSVVPASTWGPPLLSRSRTPIPSSFAPGAPPHAPLPVPRRVGVEVPAPEERSGAPESARRFAPKEPLTKPGVGSEPPRDPISSVRSDTPIEIHAPGQTPLLPPELMDDDAWEAIVPGDGSPNVLDDQSSDLRSIVHDSVEPVPSADGEESHELGNGLGEEEPTMPGAGPFAPLSRSFAHSARPLPMPGSAKELRLPAVIVDLAHDTEDLVARMIGGDQRAADRLVEVGAAAVPALVGAFPGPITHELRRTIGDAAPRASEAGPLLKVLARIGARAAGVLSVRTNDKDATVRAWATRLLGEMPCFDAARAVARRFIDDDVEVRRSALAAARLLQASASSGILASALSEMLLDSARHDRLQHMVLEAIADLREARTIPALASLLVTGKKDSQRSAHWALVVIARTDYGDDSAAWEEWWRVNQSRHRIEWLIDALMHENQEIRRTAADELKSLTKEYFGYYDDLPPRERERAQQRYREWWQSKGKARFC